MFYRNIGKIIRGAATPFQLFTAAFLGSVIAFIPGFLNAPGLFLFFTFLLLVLNANLAVAGLTGLVAKLLALALAPLSFKVGYFLIDGPTSGFLTTLINAPVFAWFGFERYLATGGVVIGAAVGIIAGLALNNLIGRFRRKMADVEKNSERYKKYSQKFWVKSLTWLLVGSRHKAKSYEELLNKKVGNPIRIIGVAFVLCVVGIGLLLANFASEPVATTLLQSSLESINGATVDIDAVEIDLNENHLKIRNLAMADARALDTDLFRADLIDADISTASLLRKRVLLDRMQISNGSHGSQRSERGKLKGPPPPDIDEEPDDSEAKTIEDYVENYKVWKERLRQAREWMDKMSGPEDPGAGSDPSVPKETLKERLAREVLEKGYAGVIASHLIEGSPTLAITEILAEKVRVSQLEGETLDISALNLSTHPTLFGKKPELHITSSGSTFAFDSVLGRFESPDGANQIGFALKNVSTDAVMKQIGDSANQAVSGGTMDVNASGSWEIATSSIDLPLQVVLRNATIKMDQLGTTEVAMLEVPIRVSGPLDNPRIKIASTEMKDALLKAGVSKASSIAKEKATEFIDNELKDKVGDSIGEQGKSLLDGFLGGKKKKNAEE